MILLALLLPASATRTPPDYREELHQAAAAQVEALAAAGKTAEALAFGERFNKQVEPAAEVVYEMGLLHNQLGETDKAMDLYDQAIAIDPRLATARYDRAELLLLAGDTERAEADLLVAAEERPDHWAIHFRLAELAARRGDPDALEAHLLSALRTGFSLRTILLDPNWRAWARDPLLGPPIARLITVYGNDALLDELRKPAE